MEERNSTTREPRQPVGGRTFKPSGGDSVRWHRPRLNGDKHCVGAHQDDKRQHPGRIRAANRVPCVERGHAQTRDENVNQCSRVGSNPSQPLPGPLRGRRARVAPGCAFPMAELERAPDRGGHSSWIIFAVLLSHAAYQPVPTAGSHPERTSASPSSKDRTSKPVK
jgi:hypothetical protein